MDEELEDLSVDWVDEEFDDSLLVESLDVELEDKLEDASVEEVLSVVDACDSLDEYSGSSGSFDPL